MPIFDVKQLQRCARPAAESPARTRGKDANTPGSLQYMAIEHHLYFISMAARLLDMHPQTLRKYERLGLVSPTRTVGSMRVYSQDELERLRLIKRLVEEEGVNLAGVQRLLCDCRVGAAAPSADAAKSGRSRRPASG